MNDICDARPEADFKSLVFLKKREDTNLGPFSVIVAFNSWFRFVISYKSAYAWGIGGFFTIALRVVSETYRRNVGLNKHLQVFDFILY